MLETGVMEATEAPVLRRHVVVVLVDRLDVATARALQYARTLSPDDLRAVHFDIDTKAARELEQEWSRLGLARLPLDIIECPDRRLGRAAIELVADATLDGDTECTVLLPRRGYRRVWQRFLHDRTADKIAAVLGQVPHVSATIVPFDVGGRFGERVRSYGRSVQRARTRAGGPGRGRARPGRPEGRTGVDRTPPAGRAAAPGRRARGRRDPGPACRGHHADRRGDAAPAGPGRRQGQVRPGAAPGGDLEPRVRPQRRDGRPPAGLPGAAEDRGDRARRPAGGRGHGGHVGPAARHVEPLLRIGRRARPATDRAVSLGSTRRTVTWRTPNCPFRRQSLTCPPARRRVRPPGVPSARDRDIDRRGAERGHTTRTRAPARLPGGPTGTERAHRE